MKKLLVLFSLVLSNIFIFTLSISAQVQYFNYSGNDAASYQCFDAAGKVIESSPGVPLVPTIQDSQGNFYCNVSGTRVTAFLRPPALQQLEVWFVRILYAIWALVASLSFLLIVKLGYDYMISRGDVTKITAIRQRIINYGIGFALVFLAVPILSTVFRFLGINDNVQCYNVNMPGFQFFYTNLCTDPKSLVLEDPCAAETDIASVVGRACSRPGFVATCRPFPGAMVENCFVCQDANQSGRDPSLDRTWQRLEDDLQCT